MLPISHLDFLIEIFAKK